METMNTTRIVIMTMPSMMMMVMMKRKRMMMMMMMMMVMMAMVIAMVIQMKRVILIKNMEIAMTITRILTMSWTMKNKTRRRIRQQRIIRKGVKEKRWPRRQIMRSRTCTS